MSAHRRFAFLLVATILASLLAVTGTSMLPLVSSAPAAASQEPTRVTAIAQGGLWGLPSETLLALRSDNTVLAYCHRRGCPSSASPPKGLTDVTAISAGGSHNLALKSDGTVVAWGENSAGQTDVPSDLVEVTGIAAGFWHSLAVRKDGSVAGWGRNSNKQASAPVGLDGVVAVAAGGRHSLALKSDGTVVAWGSNTYGQIAVPAGLDGVTAIVAGEKRSLALKSDGTIVVWGQQRSGAPMLPGLTGATAIATSGDDNLALKSDGTVVSWGNSRWVPKRVTDVVTVSVNAALLSAGDVVRWNRFGHNITVPSGRLLSPSS